MVQLSDLFAGSRMIDFRSRLSPPQRLLCDVLQASHVERQLAATHGLRDLLGDDEAFAFADRHEVACLMGHQLLGSTRPQDARWIAAHEQTQQRLTAYLQELDELARLFAEHRIELVALKNGGIARGLYPCAGCCPMGDLDLLVRPRHFRRAHELLLARGYLFEFRMKGLEADWDQGVTLGSTEYHRTLNADSSPEKLWIDFQARPVSGLWIRPDQEPSADELIDRACRLPDTHVLVLSPEDNLLQVALHTAKHSYLRAPGLRLHTDVDRIIAAQPIDWDRFTRQVTNFSVQTPVYFSLALAQELLDTPIPGEVLVKLRPARWKETWVRRWIDRAGLFEPQQHKFGRAGYIAFTALQYDDFAGFWRALFPTSSWMKTQYGFDAGPTPWLHLKRLSHLLLRRRST